MVKKLSLFWALILFPVALFATVSLQVEVDSELAAQGSPISAKLIIKHPEGENVDLNSARIAGKPIQLQLVSQSRQSSIVIQKGKKSHTKNVISCYSFEIEGKDPGHYKLDPVEIKVGQRSYLSSAASYEILKPSLDQGFILESEFSAPKTLYPGQRVTAKYRLYLKDQVEITQESYPLLELEGFEKVGERKVSQYRRGHLTIFEISQVQEAKKEGSFTVKGGFIEGLPYQEDFFFRRLYKKNKLRSSTQGYTYEIAALPVDLKGNRFSGAVGKMKMKAELLSPTQVSVGDKLKIKLTFQGDGLETIKLPAFDKQKAFHQKFRFNDMPPVGEQKPSERTFFLEVRPMKADIDAIPPLEFTYFNPEKERYETLKSESIAIEVQALRPVEIPGSTDQKKQEPFMEKEEVNDFSFPVNLIKGPHLMTENQLKTSRHSSFPVYWAAFLTSLWFLQWLYLKKKNHQKVTKSALFFKEALKYEKEPQKFVMLIEKAFVEKLTELGWMTHEGSLDHLGDEGLNYEIKQFLEGLQKALFSKNKQFDFKKSQEKATKLFKKIGASQ